MGKIFIIEVVNVMFHVFGFTVYDNPSVRVCALPLSATFLEKSQLVVRIPISVINPSPKVETASWEKESSRILPDRWCSFFDRYFQAKHVDTPDRYIPCKYLRFYLC